MSNFNAEDFDSISQIGFALIEDVCELSDKEDDNVDNRIKEISQNIALLIQGLGQIKMDDREKLSVFSIIGRICDDVQVLDSDIFDLITARENAVLKVLNDNRFFKKEYKEA